MATTTVTAKVLADTSGFMSGLNRAGKSMQKFGQKATTAGRNLSTSISLPLILIGRAAIKTATSFEFAQKKIEALRGGTSMTALTKSARDLGASTIFTAEQVSQLQLSLAKLGKSNTEIQAVQGTILKFAQAMDQELAPAGEFLVKTMNRYSESLQNVGNDTEQAIYVGNLFASVAANTALDAEKLASALNYAGSEAASYGMSLGETSAILGLLADRGFDASRGGTALRRILGQLAKEGYTASEAIHTLLDGTNGYSDALSKFGLRGAGPASSLGGLTQEFEALLSTIEGSSGFLNQFSTVMDTSLDASLKRVSSAATEVALAFAEEFGPALKNVLSNIVRLLRLFSDIPKPLKVIVLSLGTFLAIAGPLTLVIGALTYSISALTASTAALSAVLTGGVSIAIIALASGLALVHSQASLANLSIEELRRAAYEAGGAAKNFATNKWVKQEELVNITKLQTKLKELTDEDKKATDAQGNRFGSYSRRDENIKEQTKLVEAAARALQTLINIRDAADKKFKAFAGGEGMLYPGFLPGKSHGQGSEDSVNSERTLADLLKERLALMSDIEKINEASAKKGTILDPETAKKLAAELADVNSLLKLFGVTFDKAAKDAAPRWKDLIKSFEELNPKLSEEVDLRARTEGLLKAALQSQAELANLKANELATSDKITANTELQSQKAAAIANYYATLLSTMGDISDLNDPARFNVDLPEGVDPASLSSTATTDKYMETLLSQMQEVEAVSKNIGSIFESIFKTALDGTLSLGEAIRTTLSDAIKSLIAKLVGLAIAWGVIALLVTIATGGGNLSTAAGSIKDLGFANFAMGGLGLGSFDKSTGSTNIKGVLSGSDVVLSSRRGVTALDRIYG